MAATTAVERRNGEAMESSRRRAMRRDTRNLIMAITALILTFAIAIGFVLAQPWAYNSPGSEIVGLAIGQLAPEFTIQDVNGTRWNLSAYRGQVALIDFMGSNCPTCIHEMRDGTLQAIYGAYAARGLEMISIDIGGPLGTENELHAWQFLKGQSPHGTWEPGGWIIALDNQGLAPAYLVSGIPLKYLIDRTGRIAMKWPLAVSSSDLSTAIEGTLG